MAKYKNIIIYAAIAAFLLLIGLIVFDYKSEAGQKTPNSSYNTKDEGVKALYLLASKMGYNVGRYERPARFLPHETTMVAFSPSEDLFMKETERKYLKKWMENGNTFIIIDDRISFKDKFKLTEFTKEMPKDLGNYQGDNLVFSVGKGKLIYIGDYEKFTNEGLKELNPGVVFVHALLEGGNKRVLFNEYYQGLGSDSASLWDVVGAAGRILIIQIILGILVLIYIKSRPFGKPKEVLEIIKRQENENLYALTNLYLKTKANNQVLSIYLEGFKKELGKFLGFGKEDFTEEDLVMVASKNHTLKNIGVKELFEECNRYIESRSRNGKRLKRLFEKMERVRKEIS